MKEGKIYLHIECKECLNRQQAGHLAALAEKDEQLDSLLAESIILARQKDELKEQIATLTILNKQQVGEIAWQFNENRRLREALKEILNLSHGEGIHIEGQIAQAVLAEKDREHAKDITVLIKQLQIAGKQITTLKANAEFLSSELERLRSRVVLTLRNPILRCKPPSRKEENHDLPRGVC